MDAELQALREAINPRIIVQKMADIDFANGDSLCLKLGGDGDNGEYLIELMEAALLKNQSPFDVVFLAKLKALKKSL
jgi:hypothetical protein